MQETGEKNIILGGGISGLLQAYYKPNSVIISDKIGGQFSSKFQLGPKYLHVDNSTKRFFKEINIEPEIKKIKIGFFFDGKLHSENTEENRKRYFEKTRGSLSEPYHSVMTSNKTEFDSFAIAPDEIIEILKTKIKNETILEKVIGVNLRYKEVLTESRKIKYDNLISTIPLNVFLFLSGKPDLAKQYQSFPTTFIFSENYKDCPFSDFQDFNYVYVSEPQHAFHRITKVPDGIVFEFKGDGIKALKGEKDRVVMKVGQLVENNMLIDFQYVKFFGRYGCWKHGIKTNELLKEIYDTKV